MGNSSNNDTVEALERHYKIRKKDRLDKRVTIRLSQRHFSSLLLYADKEGTDIAAIIRHLVARFVQHLDQQEQAKFNREVLGKL